MIGTNGAGKSTLINILSVEIPPSSERVELLGQDVTAWSQPKRARLGLGRSNQHNTIYPSFSVFENCRLAAQAATQKPWQWWRSAQHCEASTSADREAASRAGLNDLLDWPAWARRKPNACSRCWPSSRPATPSCWSSTTWTHFFRIAEHITVMVNGTVIASDTPDGIR